MIKKKASNKKPSRTVSRSKVRSRPVSIKKVAVKGSNELKRLFFDIETSFNIVAAWNVGYKLNLSHDTIIKERAIICICYKWANESKVHYLKWDKGDDKAMLQKFMKIIGDADQIIGHNGDAFDLKWLKTRAIKHGIDAFPSYDTIDTLKLSRQGFRFNSNKLDYIGQFLGVGKKMKTGGFDLWKDIILRNDPEAMDKMIKYCIQDVKLLELVFNKLNPYVKSKTHVGMMLGGDKCSCPECGSTKYSISKRRMTATGIKKIQLQCLDCGKYNTVDENLLTKT